MRLIFLLFLELKGVAFVIDILNTIRHEEVRVDVNLERSIYGLEQAHLTLKGSCACYFMNTFILIHGKTATCLANNASNVAPNAATSFNRRLPSKLLFSILEWVSNFDFSERMSALLNLSLTSQAWHAVANTLLWSQPRHLNTPTQQVGFAYALAINPSLKSLRLR